MTALVLWASPSSKASERRAGQIISRFGGLTRLAKALGHKNVTTVQGWKERGVIPARRQQELLCLAKQQGVSLSPADFFEAV